MQDIVGFRPKRTTDHGFDALLDEELGCPDACPSAHLGCWIGYGSLITRIVVNDDKSRRTPKARFEGRLWFWCGYADCYLHLPISFA
jgi:hypothetical protein